MRRLVLLALVLAGCASAPAPKTEWKQIDGEWRVCYEAYSNVETRCPVEVQTTTAPPASWWDRNGNTLLEIIGILGGSYQDAGGPLRAPGTAVYPKPPLLLK